MRFFRAATQWVRYVITLVQVSTVSFGVRLGPLGLPGALFVRYTALALRE